MLCAPKRPDLAVTPETILDRMRDPKVKLGASGQHFFPECGRSSKTTCSFRCVRLQPVLWRKEQIQGSAATGFAIPWAMAMLSVREDRIGHEPLRGTVPEPSRRASASRVPASGRACKRDTNASPPPRLPFAPMRCTPVWPLRAPRLTTFRCASYRPPFRHLGVIT